MKSWHFMALFPYCISWEIVKKEPNFQCVGDYNNLFCTWDTDECTFWKLKYRNRSWNITEFLTCTDTRNIRYRMVKCTKNCMVAKTCTGPKHNQCVIQYNGLISGVLRNQQYEFELTGCSCDNFENHTYTVTTNDTITKLILDDSVLSNNGTRDVEFRVDIKQSICEICYDIDNVIICNINITSEWNSISEERLYKHQCDKNHCFKDKGVFINMTRLTPFTRYEMDVRCKIETSNYWSEPLHKSFKTLPEVPLRGPDIHNGSFLLYPCQINKECLALYFKTLNLYQSQGPLIKYEINVESVDHQKHLKHRQFDIIYIQQHPGTVFLNLSIKYSQSYQITVNPMNDQGPSLRASSVLLSPRKEVRVKPVCVDYKLNNSVNVGSFMLSYKTDHKYDDSSVTVTYFWCKGVLLRENDVLCEGDLYWITSNNKSSVVTLNETFEQIYFAVSLSVNGVNSGMTWKRCLAHPIINVTVFDTVIIDGAIGGFLGVVLVGVICCCLKKQADRIRSYNPEIKLPQIISNEKFQYNSYTNKASDDGSSETSGYDSVSSSASSSNPSPDPGEKIRTYSQINANSEYSLPTEIKTTIEILTTERSTKNHKNIINHKEKHRQTCKNNANNNRLYKALTVSNVIVDSDDKIAKDKVINNCKKEKIEANSFSDDSYRKVTDINTNSDIYFLDKESAIVCNVSKNTDFIDNGDFMGIADTDYKSDKTASTVSKEEIKAGYCRYNIHEIDSDSNQSDVDYQDSIRNIDESS